MKKIVIDHIEISDNQDQYFLVIRGWAMPEFVQNNQIDIIVGDTVVSQLKIESKRPDVHDAYPKVPENCGIFMSIPLTFPFKNEDALVIVNKNNGKVIVRSTVRKIKTIHHQFYIDQITFEDGKYVVDGWALSALNKKVRIDIEPNPHYEIEQVTRYDRTDVIEAVEGDNIERKSGIRLIVKVKKSTIRRNLHIILSDKQVDEKSTILLRRTTNKQFFGMGLLMSVLAKLNRQNINKAILIFKTSGLRGLFAQLRKFEDRHSIAISYEVWIRNNTPTETELESERHGSFEHSPLISLVVPVFNTKHEFLIDMIKSVQNQTYTNWELILVNGGSTDVEINKIIQAYSDQDSRIRLLNLAENRGISGNTNAGFDASRGEYIGLVDHDDVLDQSALYEMVKSINAQDPDLIYSDEDKFTKHLSDRYQPHFKPDFSYELLRSYNYFCHLTLIRASVIRQLGGERSECDGAQDYDLFLRVVEQTSKIVHIPKVLYHWRSHERSTARSIDTKSYTVDATIRALTDHLTRIKRPGTVEKGMMGGSYGTYHTRFSIQSFEKVSIIIPNKDQLETVKRCITSILRKTSYPNYEILIIENNSTTSEIFKYYEQLANHPKIEVLKYPDTFNYSAINNWGVSFATGAYYLLLNNDIEVIEPDWLDRMVEYAQYPENAVVGAKLYYPNNTIQHAGVILGLGGVAGHSHKYSRRSAPGYMARLLVPQNMSAVTAACMLVRADAYNMVEGLDEGYAVAFNDVDFCMKIVQAGYKIVWTPYAELYHHESLTRGTENTPEKITRFNKEIERFKSKWGYYLNDPHYNINLTMDREDFSINKRTSRGTNI